MTKLYAYWINHPCRRCGTQPIFSDNKRARICPPCFVDEVAELIADQARMEACPQIFDIPAVDA